MMEFGSDQRKGISVLMALVLLFCLTEIPWTDKGKKAEAAQYETVYTGLGTTIRVEMAPGAGAIKSCTDSSDLYLERLKINIVLSECASYSKVGNLVVKNDVPVRCYDKNGQIMYTALSRWTNGSLVVDYDSGTGEYTGSITLSEDDMLPGKQLTDITKIVLGDTIAAPTATAKATATPTTRPTATPTARPTATPTTRPTATPTARPTAMPTTRPTATPTAKPTATPLWNGVTVVVPSSIGSKYDDTRRAVVTDYGFSYYMDSSYYLNVTMKLTSHGDNIYSHTFASNVIFYDKNGKILNETDSDGWFGRVGSFVLGGSYTYKVFVYLNGKAGDVKKIEFLEHWTSPVDLLAGKPKATAAPTATPRVTASPAPRVTASPTPTRGVTATPGVTASPAPRVTTSPTPTPGVTATPGATASPMPRPTATSGPTATSTATPTAAPVKKGKQSIILSSTIKKTLGDAGFSISPAGEIQSYLQFVSSNTKVATVVSYGYFASVMIKGVGKTKITITAPETDAYQSAKKTVTLKVVLKKPKLKVKIKNGIMTLQWGKVKGADKYEVSVEQHGVKTTTLRPTKKTKLSNTITKGKKYTVRVRAIDKSKKYPSAWSKKTLTAT